MRKVVIPLAIAAFGAAFAAPFAVADSANFHYANASVSSGGALNVAFKETGLGTTTSLEKVTLNVADASAEYQCWNNGGKHPQAGNKEFVDTSLTASKDFAVRNGQVTGSLNVGPPGLPSDFSCPKGQKLYLMSVTYSDITISGQAGTISTTPSSVSSGPIMILIG